MIDAYAWLQNHAVKTTQADGSEVITGYLSVEKPISSPDDENVQITAFEWGMGPVRVSTIYLKTHRVFLIRLSQVRGTVDTSGIANLTVSITVPVLGPINVADLGIDVKKPVVTASVDLLLATGYVTVSLQLKDVYLEVHITSPFGNVDLDRTKIFSI